MNVHHLEIFYHVARNGGISEAVRNFPYGIQQPAVSSQILQLEQSLGTRLFHRRPFRLTSEGERLYAFIRPFFGGIGKVAAEIQGKATRLVRIGSSGQVLQIHLPAVLRRFRREVAGLRFSLVEGTVPGLMDALRRDEIDIAVTSLHEPLPAGLNSRPLVRLPLSLVVPRTSRIRSAAELWRRDVIDEPLISLPPHEPIAAIFQRGIARLGAEWAPSIVVNSLDLLETYVEKGFGIGVTTALPGAKIPAALRLLPLAGFDSLETGVVWSSDDNMLVLRLVEAFVAEANSINKRR